MKKLTVYILALFICSGIAGALPQTAYAVTCANNGTVVTFFDNGAGRCIGVITSGTGNMQLPSDWSNTNQIEVIGAGGKGSTRASASRGGAGGGSGAYGIVSNTSSLTGGSSYKYNVGAANTATSLATTQGSWFCSDTSCANVSAATAIVGAESGAAGTGSTAGAAGNAGTNKLFIGAAGIAPGSGVASGVLGGGSAGTHGAGSAGSGATAGKADNSTVNAGASGTEYTVNSVTYGSGGGGAGGNTGSGSGGGNYGSGGGGAGDSASGNTGAAGVGGLIVITYTPAVAPTVTTNAADTVTATGANINGNITATGGQNATAEGFATSTNSTLSSSVSTSTFGGSFSTGAFAKVFSNTSLTGNTTYYFRAYATNGVGTTLGSILNFLTLPGTPGTPTYSSVAPTSMTVNWSAPSGGAATYNLERCITSTNTCTLVTGIAATSQAVSSLSNNTSYDFAVQGVNATGNGAWSATSTQSTNADLPSLSTDAASSITSSGGTLNSTISGVGGANATTCGFAYGTDSTLASVIATTTDSTCPSGTGSFLKILSGLSAAVTYYFRAYATNTGGTGYGSIANFTTGAAASSARKLHLFEGFKIKFFNGTIKFYGN